MLCKEKLHDVVTDCLTTVILLGIMKIRLELPIRVLVHICCPYAGSSVLSKVNRV